MMDRIRLTCLTLILLCAGQMVVQSQPTASGGGQPTYGKGRNRR